MFTLQEALSAIKDKPEFRCNEREFGFNIDYNLTTSTTFSGATPRETHILKNLRGTCFDTAGNIISLGFDKFHNLDECPGWMTSDIDFSQPCVIMEKLDGSMVRALLVNGELRLLTRAGITDVAKLAEAFVRSMPTDRRDAFLDMCGALLNCGYTPIFEFCSRAQRIVIDYETPKLILTAIRSNHTGEYFSYAALQTAAVRYSWEVVQVLDPTHYTSVEQLATAVRQWQTAEGIVLAYASGFRVKIKADKYVLQHRALDGLRFEKDVVHIILSNLLDDTLPLVHDDLKLRLQTFQASMLESIARAEAQILLDFAQLSSTTTGRAEFAAAAKISQYKQYLFRLYDNRPSELISDIIKSCGSSTRLELYRWAIGPSYYEF